MLKLDNQPDIPPAGSIEPIKVSDAPGSFAAYSGPNDNMEPLFFVKKDNIEAGPYDKGMLRKMVPMALNGKSLVRREKENEWSLAEEFSELFGIFQ